MVGMEILPCPLNLPLPRFIPCEFSPPRKGDELGMGQDFSPAPRDRAGMGLDFLDPPRPGQVAKGYNCKFFIL